MSTTEQGLVINTIGELAIVKTLRSSTCESCDHKKSCSTATAPGDKNEMQVKVKNTLGAKAGDTVIISIKTTSLLKIYFMLYIFPILCLILGAVLGKKIATAFVIDESLTSVLSGAIFFCISFFLIRLKGKKIAFKEEYTPKILKIKKSNI